MDDALQKKYLNLVAMIKCGKRLPTAIYLHKSAIGQLGSELISIVQEIEEIHATNYDWNVLKLNRQHFRLSFLSYPRFDQYPYPTLDRSHTIQVNPFRESVTEYSGRQNPPVLHRRETLLSPEDPRRDCFSTFTKEGEVFGLYKLNRSIGTLKGWLDTINAHQCSIDDLGHITQNKNGN